uniref:Uncharacterized protein n=1 Tax=Rhizophora mucronata TaxID=61149 RepID=A0A2P2NCV0_RHIMU
MEITYFKLLMIKTLISYQKFIQSKKTIQHL